jgi:hypothetical protein
VAIFQEKIVAILLERSYELALFQRKGRLALVVVAQFREREESVSEEVMISKGDKQQV